jgi:AraC family transcriptional regulator of arabinose operon
MAEQQYSFAVLTEIERTLPFYLVGAGINFHQEKDPHRRQNGYHHYQWIQVEKGRGSIMIHDERREISENQGIFLYPGDPHEYHAIESPWIVNWFTFNGSNIKQVLAHIGLDESGVYSVHHHEVLSTKIRTALKLLQSTDRTKGISASSLVYDFLITLMRYAHKDGDKSYFGGYARLDPVFQYIERNFYKPLTIDELAKIIEVTPQHLCHLFKILIRERPFTFINIYRISKAKEFLLNYPHLSIQQVAKKSGYESSSYFCKMFTKVEQISPARFRTLHSSRSN